jgi:hypothetical protein
MVLAGVGVILALALLASAPSFASVAVCESVFSRSFQEISRDDYDPARTLPILDATEIRLLLDRYAREGRLKQLRDRRGVPKVAVQVEGIGAWAKISLDRQLRSAGIGIYRDLPRWGDANATVEFVAPHALNDWIAGQGYDLGRISFVSLAPSAYGQIESGTIPTEIYHRFLARGQVPIAVVPKDLYHDFMHAAVYLQLSRYREWDQAVAALSDGFARADAQAERARFHYVINHTVAPIAAQLEGLALEDFRGWRSAESLRRIRRAIDVASLALRNL